MSNLELLDRAANATTCQILSTAGQTLVGVGVYSLWASGGGLVPLSAGALSLLASNYLCPEMEMGGGDQLQSADGCVKIKDGVGQLQVAGTASNGEFYDATDDGLWKHNDKVTEITEAFYEPWNGEWRTVLRYNTTEGPQSHIQFGIDEEWKAAAVKSRIRPTTGTCDGDSNDPLPLPPDLTQPITYNDNVTNCIYNVTLEGFAQSSPGGTVQPVFRIEGATQQRADGGVMGGCNFPPVIYYPPGGGGDGPVYIPVDPDGDDGDDGVPWWVPALLGALGGAGLNQLINLLGGLFEPVYGESSFTLTAPCDVDENGDPQFRTWNFAKGNFQQRSYAHQVALMEIMQQHLDWKTPTCSSSRPPLEGEWVTTRWISDETMDHSGRQLRKLFRYRSKSSRQLQQLSSYWESFTWRSGNVCVSHRGAWWGNPQVWAESAEEGKRVIRFAGAEAGIDPDQVGRWEFGGSRSPRYGMPGTMRVLRHKSFPWVASRDGADWPNLLAKEL